MEQDLQNIMDAKESQDDEDMEAALHSFYKNRKTLKDKGVDESIMKEYDYEVDAILEKKNDRIDDVENAMELIENDLQNIMDAKNSQDKEDIETALHSFYENRKTLKEKGADKDAIKDFDGVVDAILEKPNIRTDESMKPTSSDMDLMEQDLQNIMDAKESQDDEDMEAALHSFYKNRKTLKDK